MHGRNAEDLVLKVPPGTIVKSVETEEVLADSRRWPTGCGGKRWSWRTWQLTFC